MFSFNKKMCMIQFNSKAKGQLKGDLQTASSQTCLLYNESDFLRYILFSGRLLSSQVSDCTPP